MNANRRNRIVGLVLLVVAVVWSVVVFQTIPAGSGGSAIGPRAFPLFLGFILIALSAAILLRSFFAREDDPKAAPDEAAPAPVSRSEMWPVAGVFLLTILYGFLMQKIGFLLATPIVVLIALAVILGVRQPVTIVGMAIGISVGCWIIFGNLLGVYLPRGSWISLG